LCAEEAVGMLPRRQEWRSGSGCSWIVADVGVRFL